VALTWVYGQTGQEGRGNAGGARRTSESCSGFDNAATRQLASADHSSAVARRKGRRGCSATGRERGLRIQMDQSLRDARAGGPERFARPRPQAFAAKGEGRSGADASHTTAERTSALERAHHGPGGGNFSRQRASNLEGKRPQAAPDAHLQAFAGSAV